jgi:hypothetical protein
LNRSLRIMKDVREQKHQLRLIMDSRLYYNRFTLYFVNTLLEMVKKRAKNNSIRSLREL